jgi:CRISPR system Cascade subunit CasE
MNSQNEKFFMLQIEADLEKLVKWSNVRKLGSDIGYACHAAMCDAYSTMRLKPFNYEQKGRMLKIIGYGRSSSEEMKATALETAEPDVFNIFQTVQSKEMPTEWIVGKKYHFALRATPTRQGHVESRRIERDAFLFEHGNRDRFTVYQNWLREKLDNTTYIDSCEVEAFTLVDATRRTPNNNGIKMPKTIVLPDVSFSGVLTVMDSDRFSNLIKGGIGRHKAFGFGALMLRQVRQ